MSINAASSRGVFPIINIEIKKIAHAIDGSIKKIMANKIRSKEYFFDRINAR